MKMIKTLAFSAVLGTAAAFAQNPAQPAELDGEAMGKSWPEFRSLDINGDGQISKDEASSSGQLSAKFADLDADKSGSLSNIEYTSGKNQGTAPADSATPSDPTPPPPVQPTDPVNPADPTTPNQ